MTRTTILLTLRKDLRRTRGLLAILYALLAGWVALAIDVGPGTPLAAVVGSGWSDLRVAALIQLNVVARLIALVAAGWAVLDDPPAGPEPFWATRPLSRNGLLIEKLVFLALVLWLPMFLARTLVASAVEPELAGMVRIGIAADGLLLASAVLVAGFVSGLSAWIRSVVVLLAAFWIGGGVVYATFLQWLSHRRLAGGLAVVLVVALGVAVLGWRYRRKELPDRLVPAALRLRLPRIDDRGRPRRRRALHRRRFVAEVSHYLRKDLSRLWPVVAVFLVLLAYRLFELLPSEPLTAEPVRRGLPFPPFDFWFQPIVMVMVGLAIVEDSPAGRDPFWATRPIDPGRMAAAKGAFVVGCVLLPVLAAEAIGLLGCGLAPHRLPAALAEAALSVAPAIAGAVAVSVLVRGVAAWFAALVALPILHLNAAGALALLLMPFLEADADFDAWVLAPLTAAAAGVALLAAAYRRWRTRTRAVLVACGWLAYVFVLLFLRSDGLQRPLQFRGATPLAAPEEVSLAPVGRESRYLGGSADDPRVPVQVRIAVDGLRRGIAIQGEVLEGRLTTPGGELSSPGEWVVFGAEHALQAALGGLERVDLPAHELKRYETGIATLMFLRPDEFERHLGRPLSYRGRLRLVPFRYVVHARLPLSAASGSRLRRGSYEALLLDFERSPTLRWTTVERDLKLLFDGNEPHTGNSGPSIAPPAFFVVHRRRGEAVPIDAPSSGMPLIRRGSTLIALGGSTGEPLITPYPLRGGSVVERRLDDDQARWGWSPDPGWLDEAELLWLKPIAGRPFEVELTIEDLVLGGDALEHQREGHRLAAREGAPR